MEALHAHQPHGHPRSEPVAEPGAEADLGALFDAAVQPTRQAVRLARPTPQHHLHLPPADPAGPAGILYVHHAGPRDKGPEIEAENHRPGEPAEAPLANTGPAEGGTINSFRERTWHLEYYILGGSYIFKVALFSI